MFYNVLLKNNQTYGGRGLAIQISTCLSNVHTTKLKSECTDDCVRRHAFSHLQLSSLSWHEKVQGLVVRQIADQDTEPSYSSTRKKSQRGSQDERHVFITSGGNHHRNKGSLRLAETQHAIYFWNDVKYLRENCWTKRIVSLCNDDIIVLYCDMTRSKS